MTTIKGILLVGGKSSRMGTDKSELIYHNDQTEKSRLYGILNKVCDETYLSHRAEQNPSSELPTIIDPGNGPLAAISEAATKFPENALLVLACDTPLLTSAELDHLIQQRDPSVMATCYSSIIDNKPEPLCAIYEPTIFPAIIEAIENNQYCPRSLLQKQTIKTITLQNPQALLNANQKQLMVAVNEEFSDWDYILQEGDEVVFIPPVAGG